MTRKNISPVIIALLAGMMAAAPVWAKKAPPEFNDEGMQLVKDSDLAMVYADPGADLSIYKKIMLMDATVAFRKNWKRDQNRGIASLRVKDKDMERIQADVAELFKDIMTKELVEAGYEMADTAGEDVLLVKPAIVDLDVFAPDIEGSTRVYSYSESAGEMTLNLELFDSVTEDKIARATDRKRDWRRGYLEWRTRVSNRADARRMITVWAKALTSTLNEARSAASSD